MSWNRVFAAVGVSLAALAALLLLLWGAVLPRTFSVVDQALPDIPREWNLTQLSSMALALGCCLMVYGLGQGRTEFKLDGLTRLSMVGGGLLSAISAGMLLAALGRIESQWTDAVANAQGNVVAADAIERLIKGGVQRMTAAWFALFVAILLLAIGVWKLFWTSARPALPQKSTFWTSVLTLGILSSASFGLMLYLSGSSGHAAWQLAAQAEPNPTQVASALVNSLTYSQVGAICLLLSGVVLAVVGLGFPIERHADDNPSE